MSRAPGSIGLGLLRRNNGTYEIANLIYPLGLLEGWLVLFDLRSTRPWPERLWSRDACHEGKTIHIVGC